MYKTLLLERQARNAARLGELRTAIEKGEIGTEELEATQTEVNELAADQKVVGQALADLEEDPDEGDEGDEGKDDEDEGGQDPESRKKTMTPEQRTAINSAIGGAMGTEGHKSAKGRDKELRSAFANYVVGNIDDNEARALGLVSGNGAVTVPTVLSKEIITYVQEENFLRRLGTVVTTSENVRYPVLVEKAEAQGHKLERMAGDEMPETDIEFDEIELEPTEFDALATVTKKLLARTGLPIEQIVMDELKKAYVRKEIQYMVHGDEVNNINPGALSKKAVAFETDEVDVYNALVKMKNTLKKESRKKAVWVLNTAALTLIETLKTDDGFPLLRPHTQAEGGIGHTLLGFPVEEEDSVDNVDASVPVIYFGDFSKFYIQDVTGSLEVQKLVELFARTNRVGFRLWTLLDAQLIHGPYDVPVYKYEITAP